MQNDVRLYESTIYSKLKNLERKFELSYRNIKDQKKVVDIYRNITRIRELTTKLQQNKLTWEDLEHSGISQTSIIKLAENYEADTPMTFNDFKLLSNIPIIEYIEDNSLDKKILINQLYSIIEYININYQPIFTNKILLLSSKTNNIRERFYIQHQEIHHIFKSYLSFHEIGNNNSTQKEQLMNKEYNILIKKIFSFLTGITQYIETITQDSTFNKEEFQEIVITLDKTISIYGLPLTLALEECFVFIDTAIQFISIQEKDFFDYIQIEQKSNN